jgi:antitoxin YefM
MYGGVVETQNFASLRVHPLAYEDSVRYNVRMNTFMTATDARKNFYSVINKAGHPGTAIAITHEGLPKVVVMSFEEYEGWQETMAIMADPDPTLREDILEGIKEMKSGKRPKDTITLDALKKKLRL